MAIKKRSSKRTPKVKISVKKYGITPGRRVYEFGVKHTLAKPAHVAFSSSAGAITSALGIPPRRVKSLSSRIEALRGRGALKGIKI